MKPTVEAGDLALVAQPATTERFAPYGTLLAPGERAWLGRRGRVLVSVDRSVREPRRRVHLDACPEARRAWLPLGGTASWIVVFAPEGGGEPEAFLLPAGAGVVLAPGVWHFGPVPLEDTTACEMLEARGPADRVDRQTLRALCDVEAVRVLLPEEPGSPNTGLDLDAEGAVLLDTALHGRLRLALGVVAGVEGGTVPGSLREELTRVVGGLRALWGAEADLREVPGIALGRDLYRALGIEREHATPRPERLLADVLAGGDPEPATGLEAVGDLVVLRTLMPLTLHDLAAVGDQVVVRPGERGERFAVRGGGRLGVEGRPVLADAAGAFASPLGGAARAAAGARTTAVLAVGWLPPGTEDGPAEGLLDAVTKALGGHLGGRPVARRIVG